MHFPPCHIPVETVPIHIRPVSWLRYIAGQTPIAVTPAPRTVPFRVPSRVADTVAGVRCDATTLACDGIAVRASQSESARCGARCTHFSAVRLASRDGAPCDMISPLLIQRSVQHLAGVARVLYLAREAKEGSRSCRRKPKGGALRAPHGAGWLDGWGFMVGAFALSLVLAMAGRH